MPKNKTITTPLLGLKITIKGWISGGDRQYIQSPVNEILEFDPVTNTPLPLKGGGVAMSKMQKRSVEKFVISIEDVSEEVKEAIKGWDSMTNADKIYALPDSEVDFIVEAVTTEDSKKASSTQVQKD